ncbi:MAG: DNA recombination protein RmuC, partial [Betaproteobacteria bacterium]|nr:DNA recombination protein RmuC [Betaproteobacteria bacterium]
LATQITDALEASRRTINERLESIQRDNAAKLEEMRKTVDEKLQTTLEERLGLSFKQVSDQLEQVHRGLGEMQALAAGVGDLKRVLTNVKTRGTWGEVQLEAMMEQVLTPSQYEKNIATRPGSSERVEFAVRLPGQSEDHPVWLPIDAKFPMEDFQRLLDAHESADLAALEVSARALETRVKTEARSIRDKYLEPPHTTDFAVLYLPTEGLYAEVVRRPGLADALQRDYRVTLCGPTNLMALLSSLQMGFRTLAIEKRSSEVWQVLGQVKTEFRKFGEIIEATEKKLQEASNKFSEVNKRSRAIEKRLKSVEAVPILSPLDDSADEEAASMDALSTSRQT